MKPADREPVAPPKTKESSAAKGAKLIVDLPADAKLFIDDRPIKTTSQHPIFATPNLENGKTYYYEVRVEVVRDGQVATDTKRVIFHAGDEVRESFANLAPATTEKIAADTTK